MKTSAKFFHLIYMTGKRATKSEVEMYGKICELEGRMSATIGTIRKNGYAKQLSVIEQKYNLNN